MFLKNCSSKIHAMLYQLYVETEASVNKTLYFLSFSLESLDSPESEVFEAVSYSYRSRAKHSTDSRLLIELNILSHPQSNEEIISSAGDDRITAVSRFTNPHFTLL